MSFSQVMRHDFPEEVPRPGPLAALRERIRHIEQPASHGVSPFGVAAIDRALPGGGLALGAVHEILGIGGDGEDGAAACGFIAGLLARLRMGPVLWCLKRPDLYGPGLLAHGLDPARLVIVTAPRDEDILWAIEEGLRAPGLVAVIGEIGRLPLVAGRRLQLAAERSGITAFLLRRWRNSEEAARERERPSAAVTRWRIAALPAREVDDLRLRQLIEKRGGSLPSLCNAVPADEPPFATVTASGGRRLLAALNPAAAKAGLAPGMPLPDALSFVPGLVTAPADPAADRAALTRLAEWCSRYSPWTAPDGADGIKIEITGSAHLWGGEAALAADLSRRLTRQGIAHRIAVASTLGAAWALARFA